MGHKCTDTDGGESENGIFITLPFMVVLRSPVESSARRCPILLVDFHTHIGGSRFQEDEISKDF